ncbi:hypothetical protein MBLNU457_4058t1 [Dothideomycetes sp. NU457]
MRRQSLSKGHDLPAVFDTGSPDWTATLIDILDWDPDEAIVSEGNGLPGVRNEDVDELFDTSVSSTPSLAASSPTTGHIPREEIEQTTDREQEAQPTMQQLHLEGSMDGDANAASTFKCPITDCNKEYAYRDNIYRHAQSAHPSHVFTCTGGIWTVIPKDDKQETPNKHHAKRKTLHKDQSFDNTSSPKRQKQGKAQSGTDRGDSASPMKSNSPAPLIKTPNLEVDDAITNAGDAREGGLESNTVSPALLHGVSEAAKDDEFDGQASALSLDSSTSRIVSPSRGNSSFTADIERKPSTPTKPDDISPGKQTDSGVISSPLSSLGTPTESINVEYGTAEGPELCPTDLGGNTALLRSLDDGVANLVSSGFPHETHSERVHGQSYKGPDVSDQDVGASSCADGIVKCESEIDELPRLFESHPSTKTEKRVAIMERKPRATADRVIASNGFENVEGLVHGGSRRKSQRKNLDTSKTRMATRSRKGRGKK